MADKDAGPATPRQPAPTGMAVAGHVGARRARNPSGVKFAPAALANVPRKEPPMRMLPSSSSTMALTPGGA